MSGKCFGDFGKQAQGATQDAANALGQATQQVVNQVTEAGQKAMDQTCKVAQEGVDKATEQAASTVSGFGKKIGLKK